MKKEENIVEIIRQSIENIMPWDIDINSFFDGDLHINVRRGRDEFFIDVTVRKAEDYERVGYIEFNRKDGMGDEWCELMEIVVKAMSIILMRR